MYMGLKHIYIGCSHSPGAWIMFPVFFSFLAAKQDRIYFMITVLSLAI